MDTAQGRHPHFGMTENLIRPNRGVRVPLIRYWLRLNSYEIMIRFEYTHSCDVRLDDQVSNAPVPIREDRKSTPSSDTYGAGRMLADHHPLRHTRRVDSLVACLESRTTWPPTTRALAKVVVGGPQPLSAPIEIQNYDAVWPELYAREAARVRRVLGGRVMRLEHVGSTSVPGLPAKPIIDMVLEVPDSADEPTTHRPSRRPGKDAKSGVVAEIMARATAARARPRAGARRQPDARTRRQPAARVVRSGRDPVSQRNPHIKDERALDL
jgi:GrpB-like predicted nucleotidyltransferase (UPF0157 family)